ncbi:MAG: hypothetical protein PVG61_03885, partial [Dehalococcoidia bacterium]
MNYKKLFTPLILLGLGLLLISGCGKDDSNRIVFYSVRDTNAEIYVMNADGSGQTRLTTNAFYDFAPNWSPDGNKIVFS